MRELRLVGVHEDGTSLLLADDEGARYQVALNDALRAALRHSPTPSGRAGEASAAAGPREVQALIRAGLTSEEAAERSGWTVEKVHRYEVPILAEREYVTRLARLVRLRHRGVTAELTLAARVAERLRTRGVDVDHLRWDSFRQVGSEWTVVAAFAAGGRQRQATWAFDPVTRALHAQDDEARWLSEDDPSPAGLLGREVPVYDVEADGGVQSPAPPSAPPAAPAASGTPAAPGTPSVPVDLVTAMRQRTNARFRGGARRRGESPPAAPAPADDDALLPPAAPVAALPEEPEPSAQPNPEASDEVTAAPDDEVIVPSDEATAAPDDEVIVPSDEATAAPDDEVTVPDDEVSATPNEEVPAAGTAPEPTQQSQRPARSGRKPSRTPVPAWKDVMLGPTD